MPYKILSLDLGATLGWAYIEDSVILSSGIQRFPSGDRMGEGLYKFNHDFLNKFIGIDEVFFEDVDFIVHRGHSESHFGYKAALRTFIYAAYVRSQGITPRDWKTILLGVGGFNLMMNETRAENRKVKSWNGIKGREKADKIKARPLGKIYPCNKLIELGWKNGVINTDTNNDEADAIGVAFALMTKRGLQLKFPA